MKTFTIENETNNITVHASAKDADAVPNSERFNNEAVLGKLAAGWPAVRLVEIWNNLPGASPVKKFTDRATAVGRIWKALQSLGEATPSEPTQEPAESPAAEMQPEAKLVTVEEATAAPETEATNLATDPVISEGPEADVAAPVAPQSPDVAPEAAPAKNKATRAKKAPKADTNPGAPREGSKTSQVIVMLKGEGGTTLEEIMTATGWQKHTTRAMLSAGGSLTKNHGLTVVSEKVGDKRVYSINV